MTASGISRPQCKGIVDGAVDSNPQPDRAWRTGAPADVSETLVGHGRRPTAAQLAPVVPERQIYDRPLSERPRLVKLGVKAGQKISLVGIHDAAFARELERAGVDVRPRLHRDSDIIFYAAESASDLKRLADLRPYIKSNGAIWVVRRKGKDAALNEIDVIKAGLAAKMVDNKVVAFDENRSAMRMVIRLVDR
jgi:hypothetical protein